MRKKGAPEARRDDTDDKDVRKPIVESAGSSKGTPVLIGIEAFESDGVDVNKVGDVKDVNKQEGTTSLLSVNTDANKDANKSVFVGRVRGSGKEYGEMEVVSLPGLNLRTGEFVYYYLESESPLSNTPEVMETNGADFRKFNTIDGCTGAEKTKVLCRIVDSSTAEDFHPYILGNARISPDEVMEVLGTNSSRQYIFTVRVIGYPSPDRAFVNPRLIPPPGTPVFLAENDFLTGILSFKKREEVGSAYLGWLLNRGNGEVPVVADVSAIASKHLTVLAATGSGKSYAVGVLLEEMMAPWNRAAVLVIDPHGEYDTLTALRGADTYGNKVYPDYKPEVAVFSSKEIHIRLSDLSFGDWQSILRDASDKMLNLLKNTLNQIRERKEVFTTADIIAGLRGAASRVSAEAGLLKADRTTRRDEDFDEATIRGLQWRIDEYIRQREIVSDYDHTPLNTLLAPGRLSIIQMTEMEESDQQLVVSVLLQRILRARIGTEKGRIKDGEFFIDFPVFIVIEEAHRFAPASGESRSKGILKTILSEGRKFGIGVALISQRPAKLDSDVLSQCMTQLIMKIINPNDQENIRESVEAITADILSELPGLSRGEGVLIGEAVRTPVLIRIRERLTPHGGTHPNAPMVWINASTTKKKEREIKAAPVVRKSSALFNPEVVEKEDNERRY
ncbi:MAG: ATP-binding protein [Thermoplasmata archaeon]